MIEADTRYRTNGTADGRRVGIRHVGLRVGPACEAAWFTGPAAPHIRIFAVSGRVAS